VKNTRLVGHSLRKEGQPYCLELCGECRRSGDGTWGDEHGDRSLNRHGHGLCSCGVLSPHLESDNARRRWHLVHKVELSR
jgi:hypothetical protein